MATTEGTLVASYNRGMRLLSAAGGVRATVVDDRMQRAPVFVFDNALVARDFGDWVRANRAGIAAAAEATTSIGRLVEIEQYAVGPLLYLRFDYTTGDAAGQNMVGKATLAACEWIVANNASVQRYMLSGGIDTDKKHSAINAMNVRVASALSRRPRSPPTSCGT
jgi:hydroxymethylglutaryl-CoA reductase (NADPH)